MKQSVFQVFARPVPLACNRWKRVRNALVLGTIGMALSAGGGAHAEETVLSAPQANADGAGRKIHLSYTLYAHWLPVLDIHTDFLLDPSHYDMTMDAKANGVIALFMKMDIHATAQGTFHDGALFPQLYESGGWSRKAMRRVKIDYPASGPRVLVLEPAETDREPVPEAQRAGAADIMASMMKVLEQIRRTGQCDATVNIFDGVRLTRMTVRTGGTELPPHVRRAWRTPSLRCDFTGQQIAGFIIGSRTTSLREPHGGSIWLRAFPGLGLVPVRMEVEHPKIGRATALLEEEPTAAQ